MAHFISFDSYNAALTNAKHIVVKVTTKGGAIIAVRMPASAHQELMVDIADLYESRTSLELWDRDPKEMISIPFDTIALIRISYE